MDSSRGFGSHRRYSLTARPVQTRFPCGSPALALVNQATPMHSPDHSTKGTPSALACTTQEWPLTAGEYVVSGSVSSPSRGAFHLSLTVLVHYRSLKVLSLGGWSPRLPTSFLVARGTQDASPRRAHDRYGTLTRSGRTFQSVRIGTCRLLLVLQPRTSLPRRPVWAPPASLATTTGISLDFFSSGY